MSLIEGDIWNDFRRKRKKMVEYLNPECKAWKIVLWTQQNSLNKTCFWVWLYYMATPWTSKMNQNLRCDWLIGQVRWRYLARLRPATNVSPKVSRDMINPAIIDQACSVKISRYWPRQFFFFASLWTWTPSCSINQTLKKRTWPLSSSFDLTLFHKPYIFEKIISMVLSTGLVMWIGHRQEIRKPNHVINRVDKTKLSCYTTHRRSATKFRNAPLYTFEK